MNPNPPGDNSLFLAIDQGGHASRAIAFDRSGTAVAEGTCEIRADMPREGWVEYPAEAMVGSIRSALTRVMDGLGERAGDVVAAGLATQRSNIACWDRETGRPLSPVISWQDRRMADWLGRFASRGQRIHDKTGLFLTAHYGASKLRWCLDNLPEVREALERGRLAWGPMASYLAFCLCRERPMMADPANASRTLLWNARALNWDEELGALFEVPLQPLPRCVPSSHHFGHLDLPGLDIPLTVVTGDQSAALYAFGMPHADSLYVNVGTGAFVQRALGHHPGDAPRLLTSVVLHDGVRASYVLEGTINGAGSALDVVEGELGVDPKEAERLAPGWLAGATEPPLFLNGISGLGAPYWVADFPSRFIGEGAPGEKIVAVIESIVFLVMENISELGRYTPAARRIVITGGLAALDGLCQRLADLSGLEVHRPRQCEATARGTAFLLAGQPSAWREPGAGSDFAPQENPPLAGRYGHWRQSLLKALGEM